MILKTIDDIPLDWKTIFVRKKTTVQIRACQGVERFKVSWSDSWLVSDPEQDLIVIQPNGKAYPCKKDIFFETYEAVPAQTTDDYIAGYKFVKKATTQLFVIPEGVTVSIETLEGTVSDVSYPDYVAMGPKGELYANSAEFFKNNLEIVQ